MNDVMQMEATQDVIEQFDALTLEVREKELRQYREILARSEFPKKSDPAKLAELVKALGKTAVDVKNDLAIMKKALEYEQKSQGESEAREDMIRTGEILESTLKQKTETIQKLDAEIAKMHSIYSNKRGLFETIRLHASELQRLKSENPLLFGRG
jgi:Sec-independent protein translocase protein TatA